MKAFSALTEEQKEKALNRAKEGLMKEILEGIRFDDKKNGDDLQARIDKANEKAEAMKTPWFAHEYIYEAIKEEFEGMSKARAEDSLYAENGEFVEHGIAN